MSMDQQKQKLGRNATIIWLGGGAILFFYDGGISNLISFESLVFLFAGMFVAAIVVGGVSLWLLKKQARYLMKKYGDPTTEAGKNAQILGDIFFTASIICCAYCFYYGAITVSIGTQRPNQKDNWTQRSWADYGCVRLRGGMRKICKRWSFFRTVRAREGLF